jgi:hypothetical protein
MNDKADGATEGFTALGFLWRFLAALILKIREDPGRSGDSSLNSRSGDSSLNSALWN